MKKLFLLSLLVGCSPVYAQNTDTSMIGYLTSWAYYLMGYPSESETKYAKAQEPAPVQAEQPPQVHVEQVRVTEQDDDNGGDTGCGYHALKNALAFATNNKDLLTKDAAFIERNFALNPSGEWRRWVQQQQGGDGEWIETEHLEKLIDQEFKNRNVQAEWSIINSEGQPIDTSYVGKPIFDILKKLSQKDSYQHVFFINTATGYEPGQHGHWFTVFMDKQPGNVTNYTIMDSLGNTPRSQNSTLRKILSGIHGIEYTPLEQEQEGLSKEDYAVVVDWLEQSPNNEKVTALALQYYDNFRDDSDPEIDALNKRVIGVLSGE